MNNEFISYLNTLHSYRGHNSNAFGEKNFTSKYYDDLMVDVPLCDWLINELQGSETKIIMLTGHAGDGKTSLMYQILKKLNCSFDYEKEIFSVSLPSGKECICIKDFSEFPDEKKLKLMKDSKQLQDSGKFVFMVANTGPLINTFIASFDKEKRDVVEKAFLEALDNNNGETIDIEGYKLSIINIVKTNNTFFATAFLDKIISNPNWEKCKQCNKSSFCHILRNRNLMINNKVNTYDFIKKHYNWLNEYGNRLTIRNMTQQLAFMITGAFNCDEVNQKEPYLYLYSNLFFGYVGKTQDNNAQRIAAIRDASRCKYEEKRLRADESLFIREDYESVFSKEIQGIIELAIKQNGYLDGFNEMIRRIYFFFNTKSDHSLDDEDIFSKQFNRFIDLKFKDAKPTNKDNALIKAALQMIYTGTIKPNAQVLPVTLNRETGYTQNVQFVINDIKLTNIMIVPVKTKKYFDDNTAELIISVNKNNLGQKITLPLFDYFEELKNGIIDTNIDAQLSKGIENIKAQILDIILKDTSDEDSFSIIVMKDTGNYEEINMALDDGRLS